MRILAWLVAVLILVGAVALAAVQFADLRFLVERAADAYTGRELHLRGDFDLDLFPDPTLHAEGVELSNASWGSEPLMLRARRIAVRIDLASLLSGPPRIESLEATGVRVLLETDPDGRGNWEFGDAGPAGPDGPSTFVLTVLDDLRIPVIVDQAEANDVRVTLRAPGEDDREVIVDALRLALDDDGRESLSVDGSVAGLPLEMRGRTGTLVDRRPGKGLELDLKGTLGALSLTLGGALGVGSSLDLDVACDDVATLLQRFGADLPLDGRLAVNARLLGRADGVDLTGDAAVGALRARWQAQTDDEAVAFDVTLKGLETVGQVFEVDGLPASDLQVEGRLAMAGHGLTVRDGAARLADVTATFDATVATGQIDVRASARGPRLAELGFGLPDLPFQLDTTARLRDQVLQLDPWSARLGDSDAAGTLSVSAVAPLRLTGRVRSERLDLTPFVADPGLTEPSDTGATAASGTARAGCVFDDTPLPLDLLHTGDIDLQLDVAQLQQGAMRIEDLNGHLKLDGGNLDGQVALHGGYGGQLQGRVSVSATPDGARLSVGAKGSGLRINLVTGAVERAEQIPPLELDLDLVAEGRSQKQLAATMTGSVLFAQGAGRMLNTPIPWLSGDLLTELMSALNPFARKEPYSELACTVVPVTIEAGRAEIPKVLMETDKIKVIGKGTVDLERERLNLEFNTQPRKGIGVSADMFVTPFVNVSGTLASPRIGLNKKGVLLEGGAAVLTGGLSMLAKALFDRAGGALDSCDQALAAAREVITEGR